VVADHVETFIGRMQADPQSRGLPDHVIEELRAFLRCGLPQYGFCAVAATSQKRQKR
jgi:hypothetical protein